MEKGIWYRLTVYENKNQQKKKHQQNFTEHVFTS